MIKIEHTAVTGWEAAVRGMRNPMNSWGKSDSIISTEDCIIGSADRDLMLRLAKAGAVHAKYRRMITVTCDITAPLYWWKEFDTYKVGTVANSCSTMHKIHAKEFTLDDFSHEHLTDDYSAESEITYAFYREDTNETDTVALTNKELLNFTCQVLNKMRMMFLATKDKHYWWQMIQLLPASYNQRRTVMLNYEVLAHIYPDRREHKLDEWRDFCRWIDGLPYSEIVTAREKQKEGEENA